MSDKPLSDEAVSQMVAHWFRLPAPKPEPQPELQLEVGRGEADAAALRLLIEDREFEPTAYRLESGWICMNCGETRRSAHEGWCKSCEGGD